MDVLDMAWTGELQIPTNRQKLCMSLEFIVVEQHIRHDWPYVWTGGAAFSRRCRCGVPLYRFCLINYNDHQARGRQPLQRRSHVRTSERGKAKTRTRRMEERRG